MKFSTRVHLVLSCLLLMHACTAIGDEQDKENVQTNALAADWREHWYQMGKMVFDAHCISCHGVDQNAAPRIGDRESWQNRSPLWCAVLLEHAKKGYMDMPPKGGFDELSDRQVEAAGEYMLSETFPELPRD